MSEALSSIRNIGPAMEAAFKNAGIENADALRDLGADEGYRRLLASGHRPHFIAYYVIVMGLQGRPWNDCQGQEKKDLRKRFDAIKASIVPNQNGYDAEMERALDRLGVVKRIKAKG